MVINMVNSDNIKKASEHIEDIYKRCYQRYINNRDETITSFAVKAHLDSANYIKDIYSRNMIGEQAKSRLETYSDRLYYNLVFFVEKILKRK